MVTASEIGNGWQSPRISFTLDLDISHTDSERTGMAYSDGGNGWQSPRISFSFNLSPTDKFFPEKRKREDVAVANYDTDFEFCVGSRSCNGWNSTSEEILLADELFVDGKILPLIPSCIKPQPVTIARHLSLEISRSQSPLPSTSHPPPNIPRISSENVAAKSLRHKSASKWKEIMLKLSKKENSFAESRGKTLNVIHQTRSVHNGKKQAFSQGSLCCPSPFVRGRFSSDRKHTAVNFTSCYKRLSVRPWCTSTETETRPVLVEGSKPLEASSICNSVQLDPRYLGELKQRLQIKDGKAETKAKHTCGRSKTISGGAMDSDRTTRGVLGNLESSTTRAAKAASSDSPQPGRPLLEGSLQLDHGNKEGMRVSSAWNVGGRWNGAAELLGFFFK